MITKGKFKYTSFLSVDMGKVFGTDKEVKSLEHIADDAYSKLKEEFKKPEEDRDFSLAENAYKELHKQLLKVVQPSNAYRTLNKGGKRAKRIEKFILQAVLMYNPRAGMHPPSYTFDIKEDPNDGMGGLKVYIDTDDTKKTGEEAEKGEIFRRLQHRATELRDAGRYDLIFNTETYVREKEKYKSSAVK